METFIQYHYWREIPQPHYKVNTDASKQKNDKIGIGVADLHRVRTYERISDYFQISNGELIAMLKAIWH